jgi:hypothetical protein
MDVYVGSLLGLPFLLPDIASLTAFHHRRLVETSVV